VRTAYAYTSVRIDRIHHVRAHNAEGPILCLWSDNLCEIVIVFISIELIGRYHNFFFYYLLLFIIILIYYFRKLVLIADIEKLRKEVFDQS